MASVKSRRPSAAKQRPDPSRHDVATLRARAEVSLEREGVARGRRAEAARVDAALLKIAETAAGANDMGEFYAAIYEIVGGLVYATNCYIALYDEARNAINFPFYVDEVDPTIPDPGVWHELGQGDAAGATGYVLRTGEPRLMTKQEMIDSAESGEIAHLGVWSETWMGPPSVRRPDPRPYRRPKLSGGPVAHATRPRGPHLRRQAHRVGSGPDAGDRRVPPAERGAGPRERDRPGPRPPTRPRGDRRARR